MKMTAKGHAYHQLIFGDYIFIFSFARFLTHHVFQGSFFSSSPIVVVFLLYALTIYRLHTNNITPAIMIYPEVTEKQAIVLDFDKGFPN